MTPSAGDNRRMRTGAKGLAHVAAGNSELISHSGKHFEGFL